MYAEYEEFYKAHQATYGPKTVVFMAVGSFYELYCYQDKETGICTNNTRDIADMLGLQVSIKKGETSKADGVVAGFPDYALHKWAARLTAAGWTVVVVDQIKNAAGKVQRRVVSRILSPSTHVEAMPANETPYLTAIYMTGGDASPPAFGIATLDLTTGTTHTYSGTAAGRADVWTADDAVQFMSVHPPKEIIYHGPPADAATLRRTLCISQQTPLHIKVAAATDFSKPVAREDYLRRVYGIKTLLGPREFLGIRSTTEETALLYLLQFTEAHAPSAVSRFHRNQPWVPTMQLIAGNHALGQLQLDVVTGIFTAALTPFGRRDIRTRLLKPLSDSASIRSRLDEVAAATAWPDELRRTVERQLRHMFDLPRLHRRVLLAAVAPSEFAAISQSYQAVDAIAAVIPVGTPLAAPYNASAWTTYKEVFSKYIDAVKSLEVSDDITPYSAKEFTDIAATEAAIRAVVADFEAFRAGLAGAAGLPADSFRLESREKEPFGIRGSNAQLRALAAKKVTGITVRELKSGGWLESPQLDVLNSRLIKLRETLASQSRAALLITCQALSDAGSTIWSDVEEWVSHLDCTQCIARISKERGFVKPCIIDSATGAQLKIKGLRHPLVEEGRCAYVQHDVDLTGGWLVYGMNASGKSTLMKAVGLSVLLAQAGCYVPAREMTLAPFRAVYTRILNQDNIFAGLSSFAVEMSELRDILRAADRWSLVLGDELCAGTESVSAQALVAAGISWLAGRGAKYIFATHLHELPEILDCDALGLQIWHLHVEHDPVTGKLIYDRSLRPGSGSTLYGLEVAKALDLPFEFLEAAHTNRRRILGTRAEADAGVAASAWNSAVVVRRCEVCRAEGASASLEVHHIEPRASADPTGILPDGTPMNAASNLVVLCQKCHDEHHAGRLEVGKLQQTSEGPSRIAGTGAGAGATAPAATAKTTKAKNSSKWSDEQIATITDLLGKFKTASLKTIKFQLEKDYGIVISESTLRSMRASGE